MGKKRKLFVGIKIPELLSSQLILIHKQNQELKGIKWVPSDNFHVTLYFIGNVNEESIESIIKNLELIQAQTNVFNLEIISIDLKSKRKKEKLIWAQLKPSKDFNNLFTILNKQLKSFKEKEETIKNPLPHITLARVKKDISMSDLKISTPSLNTLIPVMGFSLFESISVERGVIYKSLAEFTLD